MDHMPDAAGLKATVLRQTRIADLAHRTDARLVASAFGMAEMPCATSPTPSTTGTSPSENDSLIRAAGDDPNEAQYRHGPCGTTPGDHNPRTTQSRVMFGVGQSGP
jgi:hypothetical protein